MAGMAYMNIKNLIRTSNDKKKDDTSQQSNVELVNNATMLFSICHTHKLECLSLQMQELQITYGWSTGTEH